MLLSQNAYAKKHGISAPRVSAMKANGQLVMREHPTKKNKDGTPIMMVDEHASDVLNGRAKIIPVDINAKSAPYVPEDDVLDEADIQASRARKEFYLAQNEKLEYEIKKGDYILKSEAVSQVNEIASLVKNTFDNLKFHFKNNYDIKVYSKIRDDLDATIQKLAGIENE